MFDALLNGKWINIDYVHKTEGPKPNYRCPICDGLVVAKLGDVNKHHFAHKPKQDSMCTAIDGLYMQMWNSKYLAEENRWRESWIKYFNTNIFDCDINRIFVNTNGQKCKADIYIPSTQMAILFVPYGCFKNQAPNLSNDFFRNQCESFNCVKEVKHLVWVWRLQSYDKDGNLVDRFKSNRITPYCTHTYKIQRTKVLCYKECVASLGLRIDLMLDLGKDRVEKLQWNPTRENQSTHRNSLDDLKNIGTFPILQNKYDFLEYCMGNHILYKFFIDEIVPIDKLPSDIVLADLIKQKHYELYNVLGGKWLKVDGLPYWISNRIWNSIE